MSRQLRDEIVGELDGAQAEWASTRRDTEQYIQTLNGYYKDAETKSKDQVIARTENDRAEVEKRLKEHKNSAAKAGNAARDLKTQVKSSENGVKKMKKYGRLAVLGLAILGAAIGLGLGLKAPGLGQTVAAVIAAFLGFICFGFFAVCLYIMMMRRARNRARMWNQAKNDNQEGLQLAAIIEPKRTCLQEISDKLDDIEEDNFKSGVKGLSTEMVKYLN